jgi:PAS domain S-box-containing protein
MKEIPTISNEADRLKALESYSVMDSLPEKDFDAITQLAAYICDTPISLVSLLDKDRQWFKSSVGLEVKETPKAISFCQYSIKEDEVYEVQNALENELFADNPLVTGNPDIRFYAGAPLKDKEGFNLGTLCVIDTVPRVLTEMQKKALTLLAAQVINLLRLRRKNNTLLEAQKEFENFLELSKDLVCIANVDGMFYKVNQAFTTVLGYSKEELEGKPFINFVHPDDFHKTHKEVEKLATGAKTLSFENKFLCKNGKYVVLSWNTSPDPVTGNLYCIARDITLERQQQEQLYNTSTDLAAILNAAEFSIIATDVDGIVTHFNKGAEDLLGYTAAEIIGNRAPSSLHRIDELMHYTKELGIEIGENVEPTFEDFVRKSSGLESPSPMVWTYDRKDGSSFPMLLSVTSVKDVAGHITGYLRIAKDISKQKEAELNLIKSNALLDESESIAKTGSWKFCVITKDLMWSKGNYKIFEIEELPANKLYDAYRKILAPEELVRWVETLQKSAVTGQNFEFLTTICLSDNRVKHVLTLANVIKNKFGEVIAAQGSSQDVTEKILIEQSLVESNKLLDDSESIAKTGSWRFNSMTKDLMLSKGHRCMFELEGVSADQLYKVYRSRIHYDDLPKLDELDENTIKTGADYNVNYRLLFPDNRIGYISETGRPYKNNNGDIVGIQGSVQCVTEKTLADQKIAEKSKEVNDIRSALDESSIVTITDENGVITFVNDKFCSISKYSEEELLGKYHYADNPEYQLNKFIKNIWKRIGGGEVWKGDIKNRAKDGSYYWVNSTIVPFLDSQGKVYQYIAISSNITEEKLAKEKLDTVLVKLEKNNRELDQFAYIISHDLKAPLRSIYTLAEWIVADMPDMPSMVSDNFGLLMGRVQRMENLINAVLDYSRVGKLKIKKEPVDIKQMLEQITETLLPKKGFEISIKGDFPVIIVAQVLLNQIFSNLISNAIRYNNKPLGKVECYYESISGFHQFSVKDNGPGIAEKYHEKVFGFFQTIEARDRSESTGIGLSIVQKIIEEKGGSIKIESKEDEGANFIFTLPKVDDHEKVGK